MVEAEDEERKKREQREQEKITNNSDSDLSDSEGDGLCAKLRPLFWQESRSVVVFLHFMVRRLYPDA